MGKGKSTNSSTKKVRTRQAYWMMFQTTFDSEDGRTVLACILNRCGYFGDDPRLIDPQLIAFANWLLRQMGITEAQNLGSYVSNMLASAPAYDAEHKPLREGDENEEE